MYSVETCGVCKHERTCAYDYPCDECSVLRSSCKESHFEEAGKDEESLDYESEEFTVTTRTKILVGIGWLIYATVFCFGLGMLFGLYGGVS